MKLSDFDYELPPERIASRPAEPRDAARLFVHRVASDRSDHTLVRELVDHLLPGDLLVMNDARVLPARLFAERATGGRVELLFVEPAADADDGSWHALVKPARKLKPGEVLRSSCGRYEVHAIRRDADAREEPSATWTVRLVDPSARQARVEDVLERAGEMPLPPYIPREEGDVATRAHDRERYQTVYARVSGAVAAPTAGLHFTDELLARLDAHGVDRTFVTLHVGLGTFLPVSVDDVADHVMHSERLELPSAAVDAVERCRGRGGRVIAVGTTSVRVLESCANERGELTAGAGRTDLFIQPGRPFRVIDGLLTNFHLPKSTLLMLVSAFAGRERTLRLYHEAIERGYRFYSYGDAQLLLGA